MNMGTFHKTSFTIYDHNNGDIMTWWVKIGIIEKLGRFIKLHHLTVMQSSKLGQEIIVISQYPKSKMMNSLTSQ